MRLNSGGIALYLKGETTGEGWHFPEGKRRRQWKEEDEERGREAGGNGYVEVGQGVRCETCTTGELRGQILQGEQGR